MPTVAHRPDEDDPIFKPLLKASRDIDIVVGFVDEDERHRFYIASAYLSGGRVLHIHHKVYLPTYALFDEGRFFTPGNALQRLRHPLRPRRHADLRGLLARFASVPAVAGRSRHPAAGVGLARPRPHGAREAGIRPLGGGRQPVLRQSVHCFVAHSNRVGYEDGLNFWGGATVFDPNGERIAHGPYFEEALVPAVLDLNQLRRTRGRLPLLRDERTGLVQSELARILSK